MKAWLGFEVSRNQCSTFRSLELFHRAAEAGRGYQSSGCRCCSGQHSAIPRDSSSPCFQVGLFLALTEFWMSIIPASPTQSFSGFKESKRALQNRGVLTASPSTGAWSRASVLCKPWAFKFLTPVECSVPISEVEKASIEFCFGKTLAKTVPLAQLPSLSKRAVALCVG